MTPKPMCFPSTPKITPQAPTPPPAPPAESAMAPEISDGVDRAVMTKKRGRSALRIDLASGTGMGQSGLGLPL